MVEKIRANHEVEVKNLVAKFKGLIEVNLVYFCFIHEIFDYYFIKFAINILFLIKIY